MTGAKRLGAYFRQLAEESFRPSADPAFDQDDETPGLQGSVGDLELACVCRAVTGAAWSGASWPGRSADRVYGCPTDDVWFLAFRHESQLLTAARS